MPDKLTEDEIRKELTDEEKSFWDEYDGLQHENFPELTFLESLALVRKDMAEWPENLRVREFPW